MSGPALSQGRKSAVHCREIRNFLKQFGRGKQQVYAVQCYITSWPTAEGSSGRQRPGVFLPRGGGRGGTVEWGSRTRTCSCMWTCSAAGFMSRTPPFLDPTPAHPHFSPPFQSSFLPLCHNSSHSPSLTAAGGAAESLPQYR